MTSREASIWRRYAVQIALNARITKPDDVDDAAQLGVIAVFNASKVKKDRDYLKGACRNGVLSFLKQNDRLTRKQVYSEDVPKEPSRSQDFSSVNVSAFLDSLDDDERVIVALREDGLTNAQIAKATGVARQTVDARLQKIQKKWLDGWHK